MDYYIFRHGETYETKKNILYEQNVYSAEILPEGIPTIEKLANYLKDKKTDTNFTSPFKRCIQTVEIVSKITQKEFLEDNRLSEFIYENETIANLFKRIQSFHEELVEKNYKAVSLCTHGFPISALIQLITKGGIHEEKLQFYPNPGVLVKIKYKKLEYIDFNVV